MCPLLKCYDTWDTELKCDPDRDYILDGIQNGFALIDTDSELPHEQVETDNYRSATLPTFREKVENQIIAELAEGNYSLIENKPLITSALGAIPKSNSGVRLIHDASRPEGRSLNDLASKEHCKFQTFNEALSNISESSYCAKVDIHAAYRACSIRKKDTLLTGLKWKFTGSDHFVYMVDNRLPFGARKSVYHFNRLTQAIRRMMKRRGFTVTVYVDDFLLSEKDKQSCLSAYNTLIVLLRSLGFGIAWSKCIDPCKSILFLGINIDIRAGTLTLDSEKAASLVTLLKKTMQQKRLSKTQLQSLAGKLAWASTVTPWGKTHTYIFFRLLSRLIKPSHKVLTSQLHSSIQWWLECLSTGNNTRLIWDKRPIINICSDACRPGGGAFCQNGDWVYKYWQSDAPHIVNKSINIKELYMGCEAVRRWAEVYPNKRLCLYMDSLCAVHMVNSGYSRNDIAVKCIQDMSLIARHYNVTVQAFFIPGYFNDLADSISRFHSNGQIARFMSLVHTGNWPRPINGYWLCNHMSMQAELYISAQVQKWRALHNSWTQKSQAGKRSRWRPPRNAITSVMQEHFYSSVRT